MLIRQGKIERPIEVALNEATFYATEIASRQEFAVVQSQNDNKAQARDQIARYRS